MSDSKKRSQQRNPASAMLYAFLATSILATGASHSEMVNVKLSGSLGPGEKVVDFRISLDGQWVVYRAGKPNTAVGNEPANDQINLFIVPSDGGTAMRLNSLMPAGSSVLHDYAFTTDGQWIVYRAEQDDPEKRELYIIPIDGPTGTAMKLNKTLTPGGNVGLASPDLRSFRFSPDGSRIVYFATQDDPNLYELYSVPAAGPADAGVKLNRPLIPGSVGIRYYSYRISPNGQWVVYMAEQDAYANELYCVPIDGPSSDVIKLNGPLVEDGGVNNLAVSPDSQRVVYRADQQVQAQFELYSVPIRGPAGVGEKLNGPLPPGHVVFDFTISPGGDSVVYLANQITTQIELFSVPIGGTPGGGQRISGDLPAGFAVRRGIEFGRDGGRVVYRTWELGTENGLIASTPIAGPPEDAVQLNKDLPSGGEIIFFTIAQATDRVVYRADQDVEGIVELYSVPIDGPSSESVQINGFLGLAGDVISFALSPDGQRAAYLGDHAGLTGFNDEVFQLWLTSIDGSGSVVRLNGPLVDEGDVVDEFEFTPDSRGVVYIADQDTDRVDELYVSYDRPAAARAWETYE